MIPSSVKSIICPKFQRERMILVWGPLEVLFIQLRTRGSPWRRSKMSSQVFIMGSTQTKEGQSLFPQRKVGHGLHLEPRNPQTCSQADSLIPGRGTPINLKSWSNTFLQLSDGWQWHPQGLSVRFETPDNNCVKKPWKMKSSVQIIILETALSPASVTACKLWLAGLQASCYRGHHSDCHCTDEETYSEERHNRGCLAELIRMGESRSSSHTPMQELHSN